MKTGFLPILVDKLLDKRLKYVSHEVIDDMIYIHAISNRESINCPYCLTSSTKVHSCYRRSFQDLPIQRRKITVIINNRKVFCTNPDYANKTFAETFDFLPPKAKKSNRLEDEIINISMNVSALVAEQILKNSVANVGKSAICNLLKKDAVIIDKGAITKICIDDFAMKKRRIYGTVMIDIESRNIVDLLHSRVSGCSRMVKNISKSQSSIKRWFSDTCKGYKRSAVRCNTS